MLKLIFLSNTKGVIEKKLVLGIFSNNKSTIITCCFHGGGCGQCCVEKESSLCFLEINKSGEAVCLAQNGQS